MSQQENFAEGERIRVFAPKLPGLVVLPREPVVWLSAEVLEVYEDGAVLLSIQKYEGAELLDPAWSDSEWWSARVRVSPEKAHLISRSYDEPASRDDAMDSEED